MINSISVVAVGNEVRAEVVSRLLYMYCMHVHTYIIANSFSLDVGNLALLYGLVEPPLSVSPCSPASQSGCGARLGPRSYVTVTLCHLAPSPATEKGTPNYICTYIQYCVYVKPSKSDIS